MTGELVYMFILILCIWHLLLVNAKYTVKPVDLPENLDNVRIFTDDDLAKYDGTNPEKLIYMAIKGVVFDVTSGGGFYAPGASYNALTGKDCTRAVAKMSLDEKDLNRDISDLGDEYLKSLDNVFQGTYMKKYPIVGYMDYLIKDQRVMDKTDL